MKRNKMTVEISADADHGEHVIALRRELKAAYQRWLEASDDELTEACEQVLSVAAERSALREAGNE